MNPMQENKFRNVNDFLEALPEVERQIVDVLRELILDSIPHCKEKLSYNVPFYSRHQRICFIWPPSVKWGKKGPSAVQLGFCKGFLLNDESGYLEKENRKEVYIRHIHHISEIDTALIRSFLYEAVAVDEHFRKSL